MASSGIDDGSATLPIVQGLSGQDLQARNPGHRFPQSQSNPFDKRHAHADTGERPRTYDHPQPIQAVQSQIRLRDDALNRERRSIEADMQDSALASLETFDPAESYSLALFNDEWHQGVIGILASRLKDKFHRPVIAFARAQTGELKGSGRSISGLHLRDALDLGAAGAAQGDVDLGGAGVEGVLDQFLDHGGGAFDDFAGSDPIRYFLRQDTDGTHCGREPC